MLSSTTKTFAWSVLSISLALFFNACALTAARDTERIARKIAGTLDFDTPCLTTRITAPPRGAVIPCDLASPLFRWEGPSAGEWIVRVTSAAREAPLYLAAFENPWVPPRADWEKIKAYAPGQPLDLQVFLVAAGRVVARAETRLTISIDPFAARIVYQELPVPFHLASANPRRFRWRSADPSAYGEPETVLSNLPYCACCHTFSRDGKVFGLDIDYRGDKGGYILADVSEHMAFDQKDVISWNAYKPGEGEVSRGLFAKISPQGDFVLATVKERPFLVQIDDPAYSQLFFPLSGHLVYYSRAEKTIRSLPGADDPSCIQTSPAWSPDGKTVAFARGEAPADLWTVLGDRNFLVAPPGKDIHELNREYRMRFDLWHLPFNAGRGGTAEPLAGASGNGMSNYFPRYSPDGRWIVFCQSDTGLVSQPGSRLVIIPARGGKPRTLRCNRPELNSWHSFSPNGRWLVFSSKPDDSPYTRVYLTHIDENGEDAPAIWLHRLGTPGLAAILPEAVALAPDAFQAAHLREP